MSKLRKGLILSCPTEEGSPLNAPEFIAAFASALELGGVIGVRVPDPQNVPAIRIVTRLPIIRPSKGYYPNSKVLFTPTINDVNALVDTGADIMVVDATKRKRPNGAPRSYAIDRNYQTPFKPTKQIECSFPGKIRIAYPPNVPPQSSGTGRIPD